jgi:hypothetical protein
MIGTRKVISFSSLFSIWCVGLSLIEGKHVGLASRRTFGLIGPPKTKTTTKHAINGEMIPKGYEHESLPHDIDAPLTPPAYDKGTYKGGAKGKGKGKGTGTSKETSESSESSESSSKSSKSSKKSKGGKGKGKGGGKEGETPAPYTTSPPGKYSRNPQDFHSQIGSILC